MDKRKTIKTQDLKGLELLKCGELVYLEGFIITGRDSAHKRIVELLNKDMPLPFEIKDQIIYYTGPCPAPPRYIIGSCGPTTSSRMDAYTPQLLDLGLKAMIGKGPRSLEVIESMKKNKAVYLAATGGAGALIASCVKLCTLIAFDDLGPEAVYQLYVEQLPLIVAIDSWGNSIY
jgi:fumarate hydratase subunit beta